MMCASPSLNNPQCHSDAAFRVFECNSALKCQICGLISTLVLDWWRQEKKQTAWQVAEFPRKGLIWKSDKLLILEGELPKSDESQIRWQATKRSPALWGGAVCQRKGSVTWVSGVISTSGMSRPKSHLTLRIYPVSAPLYLTLPR